MAISLAFADEKLRQTCESNRSARRRLDENVVTCLQARLADLRAADSLSELITMELARLDSSDDGRLVIPLGSDYVLAVSANHRPEPRSPSGKLEWEKVSRIKILSIGRANEN